jgi:hypothetical protein
MMRCLPLGPSHLFLPFDLHRASPAVAYPSSPSLAGLKILIRFSLLRLRSSRAAPAPDTSLPLPLLTDLLQPEPPSPPPPTAATARGHLLLLLLLVAWGELLPTALGELLLAWPTCCLLSTPESTGSTSRFGPPAFSSLPSRLGLPVASSPHPSPSLMSPNGVGPNARSAWPACRLLSIHESTWVEVVLRCRWEQHRRHCAGAVSRWMHGGCWRGSLLQLSDSHDIFAACQHRSLPSHACMVFGEI